MLCKLHNFQLFPHAIHRMTRSKSGCVVSSLWNNINKALQYWTGLACRGQSKSLFNDTIKSKNHPMYTWDTVLQTLQLQGSLSLSLSCWGIFGLLFRFIMWENKQTHKYKSWANLPTALVERERLPRVRAFELSLSLALEWPRWMQLCGSFYMVPPVITCAWHLRKCLKKNVAMQGVHWAMVAHMVQIYLGLVPFWGH